MKISIAEIIGVLGFIIALLTFILTRFENRKILTITLYDGIIDQLNNPSLLDYYPDKELIIMDIINNGNKPIVIDKDSIRIILNGIQVDRKIDWLNIDESESILNAGHQIKYGVYTKELFNHVGISKPSKIEYPIEASLKDVDSKRYKSKPHFFINNISQYIYKK